MAISFNNIPSTIRIPWVYIEFDNSGALKGDTVQPYTSLLIGQKLSPGTAAYNEPILITSDEQATELFGEGSMLTQMVKAYRKADSFTALYCMALADDPAGSASKGSITCSGIATASGTIVLYVNGERVTIGVTAEDTAAEVATAIAAAINGASLPVAAAVEIETPTVVDLTCKWKGVTGDDIDIRFNYYSGETLPAGVTATITPMSGGTANPDVSAAFAALGDFKHYNIIAFPYTDGNSLNLLDNELDDRWGPLRQLEGLAFVSVRGSVSDLGTFGDSNNSQNLCIVHASGTPTATWEVAANAAALAAFYGNIDPARPFQTLELNAVMAPLMTDRFTLQERNILLYDGISTWKVDDANDVRAERFITSYKKSPAGADDRSYLDICTVLTLGRLRYSLRNYLLLKYPRHKLASGDITQFGAGQAIATPDSIKGDIIGWYWRQMDQGLVEDINAFKTGLIVERNANDENRVDILLTPDLVNQLMVIAAQMKFIL